jgi:phage host-nuclease inhibitor protein Gam
MARIKKPTPTTIATREALEARMADFARNAYQGAKLEAQLNTQLADVRARYEAMFADLETARAEIAADLEAWAALHPADFGARKSIDLMHGVIGYRTGQPALKPVRGVRWEDVLAQLIACNYTDYVRNVQEVDKARILAEREAIGEANLASIGLRCEQAERFFIEPKQEEGAS